MLDMSSHNIPIIARQGGVVIECYEATFYVATAVTCFVMNHSRKPDHINIVKSTKTKSTTLFSYVAQSTGHAY